MPTQFPRILARDVRARDVVLICGRPEIVTRVEHHGDLVHVYAPDDPSDPYLLKRGELVSLISRP